MKLTRKKVKIDHTLFGSIKTLSNYKNEIGGGILLDESRKKIKSITYFPSDSDSKLESDGHYYDIQFHTHPVKEGADVCEILMARIPSPEDIAYTFTTQVTEWILPKGYPFYIEIHDADLFNRTRRGIKEKVKKSGKKLEGQYDYYLYYFNSLFNTLRKQIRSEYKNDEEGCRALMKSWKSALYEHGIDLKRIDFEDLKFKVVK